MSRFLLVFLLVFLLGCRQGGLPHEGKSLAQLRQMLDSKEPRVQAQGALGLSLLGAEAREAVPRLAELLESPDALVRQQSALALTRIGPDAAESVPALIRC